MSTSKYLPPFTTEERSAVSRISGGRSSATPRESDADATYADFLGDEIDD